MKTGVELIAEERKRQIEIMGFDAAHDDDVEDLGQILAFFGRMLPDYITTDIMDLYKRKRLAETKHGSYELAWAAICYAAPGYVYTKSNYGEEHVCFVDPWPSSWDCDVWDKRKRDPKRRLIPGGKLPRQEYVRNLVKAGALIAAEIDLQRRKI